MKTTTASLLVLAAAAPALLADINAAPPVTPTPQMPTRVQGNCDLLASNTIRATFQGVQELQTQSLGQAAPVVMPVAVFEVVENIAYQLYVRYGDGQLMPGSRFTVALSREIPGQPADIADTILAMQPGEEALMKIDHLYIYGGQEGKPLRPCSRMVRRAAATPQLPSAVGSVTAPQPQAPQPQPQLPAIGGQASISAAPIPAPAPKPTPEPPVDDSDDDTTIETAPQNEAPIPEPTPVAPAQSENF